MSAKNTSFIVHLKPMVIGNKLWCEVVNINGAKKNEFLLIESELFAIYQFNPI